MKEICKTYLNEQFGGDADIVQEIYNEYVSSVSGKIGEAETALAAGDWDALDKIAHTIKGNALAAGDAETAEVGIALRGFAKLQDRENAVESVNRLKELSAGL